MVQGDNPCIQPKGATTHALRIDHDTEFVNWDLQSCIKTKKEKVNRSAVLTFIEWHTRVQKKGAC